MDSGAIHASGLCLVALLLCGLPAAWALPSPSSQTGAATSTKKKETGSLFELKSKLYGKCYLLTSPLGLRLQIVDKQLVVALAAPTWRLTMYNQRLKKYFETDAAKWQAPSSITVALYRPADSRALRPVASHAEELKGLKTTLITLAGEKHKIDPKAKHHWGELAPLSGQYWVLTDCSLPAAAVTTVQKMFAVPPAPGLPLQLIIRNQRGSSNEDIMLTKASAALTSVEDFVVPTGFAPIEEQGKLFLDDRTEGVENLF